MPTQKQIEAARRNIRKAQRKWQSMSSSERSRSNPEGRRRIKAGRNGNGDYYHVEVRDKFYFELFRTYSIGSEGIQRVDGRQADGRWLTLKWLFPKTQMKLVEGRLVPLTEEAQQILAQIEPAPRRVKGDIFHAKHPARHQAHAPIGGARVRPGALLTLPLRGQKKTPVGGTDCMSARRSRWPL